MLFFVRMFGPSNETKVSDGQPERVLLAVEAH